MRKELKDLTLYFGIETQIEKLKEEVNELIEAIRDFEDYDFEKNDIKDIMKLREHITEETADVLNVVDGLAGAYDINEDLLNISRQYKMIRTKLRNEAKYYENI